MRGRTRAAVLVSLGIAGAVAVTSAQAVRQVAYLKSSNGDAGDHFGCGGVLDGHAGFGAAVSGDGSTIAIGAPHESSAARGLNGNQNDNSAPDAGAVYVFTRRGANWSQQAYVKASNADAGDHFGHAVALSADGNTMAVSAFWESGGARGVNGNQADNSTPQSGAVYVFTRQGATWTQQAYVKASNAGEAGTADSFGDGDQFGFSLALSDDGSSLAVGAITEDGAAAGINGDETNNAAGSAGAVYVYSRTGNTWAQRAYVKPANPDAGDMFGYTVSVDADGRTLAVGSYDEGGSPRTVNGTSDNTRRGAGAVYVFARTGAAWAQQAYIHPSNSEAGDSFGVHVVLSDAGDTLLAGSLDEDCVATGVNPVMSCDDDRAANISTGAAYVFVRAAGTWSQQAYLKASNTMPNDWFGSRLALSGDGNTAAIGAALEGSAAQGINGRQNDASATDAGAVYVFTRRGAEWGQQAYVKGSNTQAFDEFGSAVALSRDGATMVVTSKSEDSAARGIDGNQADNSAEEAGAAYVFGVTAGP